MPTEKNAWDIGQMKEKMGEMTDVLKGHTRQLQDYETFKAATVEKLLIIFAKLEELQEGDRWIKRIFVTALVGAVTSAVISLVVWAFQN